MMICLFLKGEGLFSLLTTSQRMTARRPALKDLEKKYPLAALIGHHKIFSLTTDNKRPWPWSLHSPFSPALPASWPSPPLNWPLIIGTPKRRARQCSSSSSHLGEATVRKWSQIGTSWWKPSPALPLSLLPTVSEFDLKASNAVAA